MIKKWFVLTEVTLGIVVMILAFFMLQGKYSREAEKVSVIVQDSDDDQWAAFLYGLKMAAQDQEIELFVVTTGSLLTAEEQKSLIEEEIDRGVDAIILQPAAGAETKSMLEKMQKKLLLIQVEYTALQEGQTSVPTVAPDNYAMGAALAEELMQDFSGNIAGKTLGIFSAPEETKALQERRQGLADALEDTGAVICWEVQDTPVEEGKNILEMQEKVDFVIALDDRSVTVAGKASAARNLHGALVYGIGHSTEAVYYLDGGYTECLVVPDEFNVGYQSLTEAVAGIRHPFGRMQDVAVSYTVMRRENLFSEENQEILFTMSQ